MHMLIPCAPPRDWKSWRVAENIGTGNILASFRQKKKLFWVYDVGTWLHEKYCWQVATPIMRSPPPGIPQYGAKTCFRHASEGYWFWWVIVVWLTSYRRQGVGLCKSDFREKRPIIRIAWWVIWRRYFDSIYSRINGIEISSPYYPSSNSYNWPFLTKVGFA